MRAAGFSYPEFEILLNKGLTYYYCGDEYTVGGFSQDDFSEYDRLVCQNGCWLPDETHLFSWLNVNGFSYSLQWSNEQKHYCIEVNDSTCNARYSAGGIDVVNTLAKVIIKICKSKLRSYVPVTNLRLEIIHDQISKTRQ